MLGSVRLVIEQDFIFIFTNQKIFLVILTLHNWKTTCDRRKPFVDLESRDLHRKIVD